MPLLFSIFRNIFLSLKILLLLLLLLILLLLFLFLLFFLVTSFVFPYLSFLVSYIPFSFLYPFPLFSEPPFFQLLLLNLFVLISSLTLAFVSVFILTPARSFFFSSDVYFLFLKYIAPYFNSIYTLTPAPTSVLLQL